MKKPEKSHKQGRPRTLEAAKSLLGKKIRLVQSDKKNDEIQRSMGIKSTAFRRYLSGESVPDARALASLAAETGVDLNWLLDDSREIPEGGEAVYQQEAEARVIDLPEVEALRKRIGELERHVALAEENAELWREKAKAAEEAARTAGRKEANGA